MVKLVIILFILVTVVHGFEIYIFYSSKTPSQLSNYLEYNYFQIES